jgi:large subunit ribosomal protein L10
LNREEKAAAVAELTDDLKGAEAVFAVDYRGISVTEAAELRAKLRDADAVFKVVKNRLAKRAAADAGTDGIDDLLVGPTALTLIKGDAVIAAKTIYDFAKEHDELEYKGGFMDGEALDPDGFQVIARLPGLDVLRGQLVGMAASPLTGLVAGLGNMISGLGRQLAQMAEQGLVTGEAPAEEAPAEEAPAAAAPAEEAQVEEAEKTSEETAEAAPEEADTAEGDDAPAAEPDDDTPEEVEAEGETSEGDEEE